MLSKAFKPSVIAKLVGLEGDYEQLDLWGVIVEVVDGNHINIVHPESHSPIITGLKITPAAAQLLILGKLGVAAQDVVGKVIGPGLKLALNSSNWAKGDLLDQLVGQTTWTEVLDGDVAPTGKQEITDGDVLEAMGMGSKGDAGSIFDDDPHKLVSAEQSQAQTAIDLKAAGYNSDETLKNQHEDQIDSAPDFSKPATMKPLPEFDVEAAMAPPGNNEAPDDEDIAPPTTGTFTIPNVKEAMGMDRVKLKDATKMYQPVFATSENSTYHCVGIAGEMKFAARRKGQDLSIRVEGPVKQYKSQLITGGFNEDYIGKGYTSVHFHGLDDVLASRTIAAVLSGVGLNYETPIPNINNINQKGS